MSFPAPQPRDLRATSSRDIRKTGIHPDYWYPLALSSEIAAGKARATRFAGQPLVIVRTASNRVFTLDDRCAHRQVPLHAGVVEGESLRCGYHGWAYDCSGRCVSVPYLDKDRTLPNGVRAYPTREAYGLVFAFMGNAGLANSVPFPEIPTFADPRYKTRYLNRTVDAHYSFMHENLMDMNHQFLHRRLMGRIRTVFRGMRRSERFIEADYTFARTGGRQHIGEKLILRRGRLKEGQKLRDLMTIRTEYPYQTLTFTTADSDHPALSLWNCYIPVDRAQRVNHTFGLMMFRRPRRMPWILDLLFPGIVWFTEGIFAEDRWIVEEEQKAFDAQGRDGNQEIFPIILGLRELLVANGVTLPEELFQAR
jgi:phenylpropionate dioxygenase-like ring-hydroxylating dioxygenase large terminal subunit